MPRRAIIRDRARVEAALTAEERRFLVDACQLRRISREDWVLEDGLARELLLQVILRRARAAEWDGSPASTALRDAAAYFDADADTISRFLRRRKSARADFKSSLTNAA